MTDTKHTPGPWANDAGAAIDAPQWTPRTTLKSGRVVAFRVAVCRDGDIHTVAANARLIAAAPELLAALKDLVRLIIYQKRTAPSCERVHNIQLEEARAAIAKAQP